MKHAGLDLLGLADIPEVLAKVSTGAARDVHALLILVVTSGAFPFVVGVDDDFTVKSANVAVVALGVELGILDIVVNKADDVF